MQNITLQTSDSDLTINEVLGRLAFAASNDSSGSDAILVAASVYAMAESEFTVSSNATSLVFATASSEAATNKLKITSEGHFIPFTSGQYDLGSSAYPFRALHVDTSVYSPSGSFDYLVFNTGIADADLTTGQVAWGNEAGTLEIGLTDDVKIQVGQTVLFRVKNSTGSTLSKGQAVYASGVLGGGQIIQAAKFAADNSVDEVRFIGLMTDDLANGDDGFVNHFGHIKNVDLRTSNTALNPNGETWAVGDILYVDDGTAGGLTKTAPQDDIYVAMVLADGQNGELFVRITDPGHITDLHDVNLTGLVDNNLMVWNSGAGYWEPTTSMTFNGTTLHTDTDGITAIFGRNNAQTQGGKVRIYVDDNDTAGSVQAIKAFNAKTTGTNYGINATAHGLGATKNVGLYGWAAQATTNWGLWVNSGYGIFDDKVGIKTQSPAFDLHVNGSGYFTNDVYYGGDLVIAGDLFVNGSGIIGDIGIVDNTISSLSGNLLLFPECSGYVGVNTDDPNAMLHVYSATSGDNIFNVEGTNGSLFSVVDNLSGTLMSVNTIAGLPVLEVNSDYSVTAGRFNQNDFVITTGGDIGMGIAAPSGKLHIYDNNSAGYNDTSFRVQNPASTSNTYFDIAIGTSTGYNDNVWFKRNGVNVAGIYSNNKFYHYTDCLIKTDKQFVAESNANAFIELLDLTSDMRIGYVSDLRFYSSYSEKMVLDVNGNLGIGTASPVTKLDVSGVITASGGNSNEWNQSYDWVAASGGLPYVTGVGAANQVAFFNDTDSITSESNLYWDSTNNMLGINDTTPSYTLDVNGDIKSNGYVRANNNAIYMGTAWGVTTSIYTQSGPLNLVSNGNDITLRTANADPKLIIKSGGNVGIGTTSPSATLDVNGSVNVANDVIVGGNVTINGTTVTANTDSMQVKDPIITLGLASGNVITNDTYDRGLALIRGSGLTAFMGWDASESEFSLLSSGVAANSSGNYTPGTYGDLHVGNLDINQTLKFDNTNTNRIHFDTSLSGAPLYIQRASSSPETAVSIIRSGSAFAMGINKVSPAYSLDVDGNGHFTGAVIFDSTIDAASLGAGEDNSVVILDSDGKLRTDEIDSRVWGSSLVDGSGSANYISKWSDADTLTTSQIHDNGTNVGINTTATESKKFVVNSNTAYDGILVKGNGAPSVFFSPTSSSLDWRIGNAGSNGNYFTIASSTSTSDEHFVITSGGNVGIGDNSPSYTLDVNGSGRFTGAAVFESTIDAASLGAGEDNSVVILDSDGKLRTDEIDSRVWGSSLVDGAGSASGVAFWTDSNTLSYDSGLTWNNTNKRLSIGTNLSYSANPLYIYTANATNFIRTESASEQGIMFTRSGIGNWLVGRESVGNKFVIANSSVFGTSADRFVMDNNGNVGIGTSSPGQQLDIRYPAGGGMALLKSTDTTDGLLFGDMAYSSSNDYQGMKHAAMTGAGDYMIMSPGNDTWISSKSGYSVFIRPGGNGTSSEIKVSATEVAINDNSTTSDFRVESDNNANMLFVDGVSDMVGIGTGSPAQVLHVYGGTISSERSATAGSPPNTYLSDITTAAASGIGSFHSYRFSTASSADFAGKYGILQTSASSYSRQFQIYVTDSVTPKMIVDGNGNVGIGTTSPSYPLDVVGTAGNWTSRLTGSSTTSQSFGLDIAAGTNSSDTSLRIRKTNGTDLFKILGDGKVGIGVTTPTTQLDVSGSGNFSGDVTIDGHLSAATKSFLINHPTREGHKLQYGSLESPYHGVRLTGRAKTKGGESVVELPEYIKELVHDNEEVNIQITNYKHSKTLYVDDVDVQNNKFSVKCDAWFSGELEFFWTFTAVRKDVQELQVEF